MSFMHTTTRVSLAHPVPQGIPRSTLVATLHDPSHTIKTSPLCEGYVVLSPDTPSPTTPKLPPPAEDFSAHYAELDADSPPPPGIEGLTYYEITERVPYWGKVVFRAALRRRDRGFDSVVHAPMGLTIMAKWRVVDKLAGIFKDERSRSRSREKGKGKVASEPPAAEEGEQKEEREEGDDAMLVIAEEALLRGNAMLMPFVRMNFEKAHKKVMENVVESCARECGLVGASGNGAAKSGDGAK